MSQGAQHTPAQVYPVKASVCALLPTLAIRQQGDNRLVGAGLFQSRQKAGANFRGSVGFSWLPPSTFPALLGHRQMASGAPQSTSGDSSQTSARHS